MAQMWNTTSDALTREERAAALRRVRRFAQLMDSAVHVPGTDRTVGLDALVGLIPAVGDAASALLSCYVPYEAYRLGASPALVGQMLFNIALDALIGVVPVLGDLLDVAFKANARNVELLEDWLGVA